MPSIQPDLTVYLWLSPLPTQTYRGPGMAVHTGNEISIDELVQIVKSKDSSGYPLDALPCTLRYAVTEVCAILKAPISLAATSAIATLSAACQGHNNVRIPSGVTGSVSLFVLAVAESGERKTSVERRFTQCITDFENLHMASVEQKEQEYEVQDATRRKAIKTLQSKIANSIAQGAPVEELTQRLQAITSQCPIRPRRPQLIYVDSTPEALLQGLHQNLPSAALFSSEGSSILNGNAARNIPALNALWDAATDIRVNRVKSDSFRLHDARLTMSIMIQPDLLRQFLGRKNGEARNSGLLARMLVAYPPSTQGTRTIGDTPRFHEFWVKSFHTHINKILSQYYSADGRINEKRHTIEFSWEAREAWIHYYNTIESELTANGALADVRDHASKIAENMARMAALFQIIQCQGTDIDIDSIEGAAKICLWHLQEFKRLFGDAQQMSEDYSNARALEKWLREKTQSYYQHQHQHQQFWISKTNIYRYAPPKLRHKIALDKALDILMVEGKIIQGMIENKMFFAIPQKIQLPPRLTNTFSKWDT